MNVGARLAREKPIRPQSGLLHSGIVGARVARERPIRPQSGLLPFLLTLVLLLPWDVRAGYQEGLDAYHAGDYDKALGEWLDVTRSPPEEVPAAVLAETHYAIAMLYWIGQGVPQDTAIAARWLEQAARMHHAGAQTKLGYLFGSGQGVPQNDFEALKWFQMAAWQGDADAQYNLGVLYRDGLGVEINETKALEWFREAASNGDAQSAQIVAQYDALRPAPEPAPVPATKPYVDPIPEALVDENESSTLAPAPAPAREPIPDPVPEALVDVPEESQPEGAAGRSPLADDPSRASALLHESGSTPEREDGRSPLADDPADDHSRASALLQASWILERDPQHYTIQVIAVRDQTKLRKFTAEHPDWAPWAIYEQSLKGQPLWVLVQGDYADVDLARAAAMKFPTDIQKRDQLWIRRFAMVQGLLP